jgi:predicted metal-binding protein
LKPASILYNQTAGFARKLRQDWLRCKMVRKTRDRKTKTILSDNELCNAAKRKAGVKDARIISPSDVVTAAWVRLKCQFGCDGYGQCLVCPPFTPTPRQMRKVLDCYRRAMLMHFEPQAKVKTVIADLERDIFLSGAWKAFGLGAGPCYFCRMCAVEEKQCRHPDLARPSMEACGIDVYSTAKKAGFPIEVVRTRRQCPNYYGLILVD